MDELTGPVSPHRLSKSVFPRALRNTFLPQPICGYFAAGHYSILIYVIILFEHPISSRYNGNSIIERATIHHNE